MISNVGSNISTFGVFAYVIVGLCVSYEIHVFVCFVGLLCMFL